ncbi:MAG TPA: hypothetical protein VKB80_11125 [Kofleriaceae bacterium]|nr:hypothetical protein [Kofleriaceae bacterium]
MKLRLPALAGRLSPARLRGLLRRAPSTADGEASPRSSGELIGIGLAMCVVLSLVTLLILIAAPATSGCGARAVGDGAAAEPVAAQVSPGAEPTAPAPADPPPAAVAAAAAPPAAPAPSPLIGDYECRFTRGERELAPVPCAIRAGSGGELRMEQPGGAVRLSGTVTADDAGFRLSGEVTCAAGPCPGPGTRDLLFFSEGPSAYSAVVLIRGGRFLNIDLIRKN